MEPPFGWVTDVAVLRMGGAFIADRGDHLVVRTPGNPRFHWGNFLLVTDPAARDDEPRWTARFVEEFPEAGHVAIGLPAEPDPAPWHAGGLAVESDEVLTTAEMPLGRPAPAGVEVRPLRVAADWTSAMEADIAENARTAEHADDEYRAFAQAQWRNRIELSDRGSGAFFGAFVEGTCVSELGIVLCGALGGRAPGARALGGGAATAAVPVARYQGVLTDAAFRGRGLAGHLLGVAARWAGDRGARKWVIVTESDNPAGRLYRSVGFVPDARSWQAYRPTRLPTAGRT